THGRRGTPSRVFDPGRHLNGQLVRFAWTKEVEDDQSQLRVEAGPSHDPYGASIQRRPDGDPAGVRYPRHVRNFAHVGIVVLRQAEATEIPVNGP
ncbi:MAG: hypothetical protein ABI553_10495, partial [Chloroflexota bacterium]